MRQRIPLPARQWPQTCIKDKPRLFEVQETASSAASEAFPPQSPDTPLSLSWCVIQNTLQRWLNENLKIWVKIHSLPSTLRQVPRNILYISAERQFYLIHCEILVQRPRKTNAEPHLKCFTLGKLQKARWRLQPDESSGTTSSSKSRDVILKLPTWTQSGSSVNENQKHSWWQEEVADMFASRISTCRFQQLI